MPPKAHCGKIAQNKLPAFIFDLKTAPKYYHSYSYPQCYSLPLVRLSVPITLLWLDRQCVRRCLHLAIRSATSLEAEDVQTSAAPSTPVPRQTIAPNRSLDLCFERYNVVGEKVVRYLIDTPPELQESITLGNS